MMDVFIMLIVAIVSCMHEICQLLSNYILETFILLHVKYALLKHRIGKYLFLYIMFLILVDTVIDTIEKSKILRIPVWRSYFHSVTSLHCYWEVTYLRIILAFSLMYGYIARVFTYTTVSQNINYWHCNNESSL